MMMIIYIYMYYIIVHDLEAQFFINISMQLMHVFLPITYSLDLSCKRNVISSKD